MQYSLDIKELQKIPFNKYEQDFVFVVGNKLFNTTRLFADLLSPVIRRKHYQDSAFNKFVIKNESIVEDLPEGPFEQYFSEFLELGNYCTKTLDSTRQKYYSAYFYSIGNIKEYFRLENKYFKEISTENVIKRLILISKLIRKYPEEVSIESIYEPLIKFASENFEDISKEELGKLEYEDLELIIKNAHLKLDNENSLMDFVLNKYEENHEYSKLFEYVIFTNLSEKMINKFIQKFDIENLDNSTWSSICRRLLLACTSEQPESTRYNIQLKFEVDSNNKFNGILKYLSDKTNGNIMENGTIGLTANYAGYGGCVLKNMVNFNSDNYYQHNDNSMSNISFDFKDRSIKIEKYAIHTGTYSQDNGHMKSWILEGFDGQKWIEIDKRENEPSLNGDRFSSIFEVKNKLNKFYKTIRLRQIGLPWRPNSENIFEIMYIEFYGSLKEKYN